MLTHQQQRSACVRQGLPRWTRQNRGVNWVALLAFLAAAIFLATRSPLGQRYEGTYPHWVKWIGGKRPPRSVAHPLFTELTWVARKFFPFISTACVMWGVNIFTGEKHPAPIRFLDLLNVNALVAAVMLAGLPFAPTRRNGPISLWVAWIWGMGYVITALGFPVLVAVAPNFGAAEPGSFWFPLLRWSTERSWWDTAAVVVTLLGVALGAFALVDGSPDVGAPETTPADLRAALNGPSGAPSATRGIQGSQPHKPSAPVPPARQVSRSKRKSRRKRKR